MIKRATVENFKVGGQQHSGWLPPGASTPLPTPVRYLTLDISIEPTDPGYLLIFTAREDPQFGSDYWFESLQDAEAAAQEWFGVESHQWRSE